MAQQHSAGVATIIALTFMAVALSACATKEQPVQQAAVYEGNGTPEFHQASIGSDALRGELPSEN